MTRFKPRLDRRPVKYRLTVEGKLWLAATMVFWATGALKGINLVTLLAYFMLAMWIVNFIECQRRLRHLRFWRRIDAPIFAQMPVDVEVNLQHQTGRFLGGVRLEDRGPEHAQSWFIPWGGKETSVRRCATIVLPRRGWYAWEPLTATSGYPFGLIQARALSRPAEPVIVFPRLGRLHRDRLHRFLSHPVHSAGQSRHRPFRHPTAQSEVHGVRAFRSGDSPRWIHWRTTARRSELMIREFEETPTNNLVLVLEPWVPADDHKPDATVLEDALELASTICREWCRQPENRLVVASAGFAPVIVAGAANRDLAVLLLEYFAVHKGHPQPNTADLLDQLAGRRLPPAPVLLISTRAGSTLRHQLAQRLRRPVAFIDAADLTRYDFYERPAPHAR
jgi:uncharacterized protein (DUF58 family)